MERTETAEPKVGPEKEPLRAPSLASNATYEPSPTPSVGGWSHPSRYSKRIPRRCMCQVRALILVAHNRFLSVAHPRQRLPRVRQ